MSDDFEVKVKVEAEDWEFLNRMAERLDREYPAPEDMNKKRIMACALAIQYAVSGGHTLEMLVHELRGAWPTVSRALGRPPESPTA